MSKLVIYDNDKVVNVKGHGPHELRHIATSDAFILEYPVAKDNENVKVYQKVA